MIPIEEIKATVESPLCDELAKYSPNTMFGEMRRLRYGASDQNLSDWDWLKQSFGVSYLYITGFQDGWRGGGKGCPECYRYSTTNLELTAGQLAGRTAHKACYNNKPVETGGIREGL